MVGKPARLWITPCALQRARPPVLRMTPQQRANQLPPGQREEDVTARPLPQEWSKKMKPIVQRRRSTSSALSKALSKSRSHASREIVFNTSHPDNGLPARAFGNPNSIFILDDRVQLTTGLQTQERHLFLFSDTLIIAKSRSSSSLKLKKQLRLSEVWTGSCLSEVSEKRMSPENSFVIGWPTTNYVVTCSSPEVKERWLSMLLWHINEMKQNEYPKSLSMQILLMDGDNSSSNTTVSVSNMESTDDIIKKTTQQLGLPGRPSDYHLWVVSGRDDPPYPLIGHEHPFSIILSCLRDSLDQLQGSNHSILLTDEHEASLLDQLPRDRQCQFILKPKPHAPVQLRRETLQKHTKRKKSLIDWALRRSTSTPTGSPASQSPTTPRKLFGLSLTSVCPDGSLPKPIMDILQLLYHEGPSTRGIFRRSANAKICKELKEKLNSGDDVQVDGESVFVAAAVITDFLRNIPDSVLSSDMHRLWMEAMDKENRVHKVEAIKSLVNQLPEANLILLRHLFGVLHHIEQNSMENQMNAFNLALCIAPNMLWLPSPTGPEEESRSTKKVAMLVQFLIENSAEIFGGDVASLFQRPQKEKARSVDDLLAQHDSSDEMEFAASYRERAKPRFVLEAGDGLYSPSSGFLLSEEQEDWDLFSEITACYQSKARKNASADSYDLLAEEEGSFRSAGSICSLSPPRNRCSSEPSVCLSSQLPGQDHEPVARQSSCDATIMHSHGDYIRRLQQLQLESQKLLEEGLSPGPRRAKPDCWRSPPSSLLGGKPSPHKASRSNRSSFSSLSSTTTSPSASSLSSLDSAFSYCSESSAFSPADVSSLPFMFGTSARLQTLSPKTAKRSLKEWHKPWTSPLPLSPGDLDLCLEDEGQGRESSCCREGGAKDFGPIPSHALGSPLREDNWGEGGEEARPTEPLSHTLGSGCSGRPEAKAPAPKSRQQVQREKSVKHIEIKATEGAPRSQESLKRTKITVYMAPKERSPSQSPVGQDDEDVATSTGSTSSEGSSNPGASKSLQTVRVHIPQTVFYGQNTPLVLQSLSRRYHHESMNRPPQVTLPPSAPLGEEAGHPAQQTHTTHLSKAGNSSTFSHTFHIFLPASIRNTVREYFGRDGHQDYCVDDAEAVENELIRSRAEWLRGQPHTGAPAEELNLIFAEETFV
ncbi:rho GTPase-activating protein 20-like [Hemicordylus capensis]|uniref:rho GTPase-activating protein 20-like n=1 Tax=Hemicordylus capensis TaxID=884348 RepID=UPI002303986C|nr:rho GTPase-activating protein 20-like [Hemicordylus capensis]